jgi:hypothetical protein
LKQIGPALIRAWSAPDAPLRLRVEFDDEFDINIRRLGCVENARAKVAALGT